MSLVQHYTDIELSELLELANKKHEQNYRFVQMLCVTTDKGIDALYTFMKGNDIENYTIKAINTETTSVPSISHLFLAAFPFENEAHDLFGLNVTDIAIDFMGDFYMVAMDKPMTVISPEVRAAKLKAAKIAAAKAAKAAREAKAAKEAQNAISDTNTPIRSTTTNVKEGE